MCTLIYNDIINRARELEQETVSIRRDLHKHPESGFFEFRTMSVIYYTLTSLGYDVKYGDSVTDVNALMAIPSISKIKEEKSRAISEGADEALIRPLPAGCTGLVATLRGNGDGKVVAFRFDMDSNELCESESENHKPYAEGFSSIRKGMTHACGHDGHVAIGLTLAKILAENKDKIRGTVKLIFQPAEEGVRGAAGMVAAGVVDDVDFFFSGHIGISANKSGELYTSTDKFLCASKFDAEFFGKSAHAGLKPQEGKNALLAAAQAALSLHGISRHGAGASRINVGVLNAGTSRNVIPDHALLQFETRGENSTINDYMIERSKAIIQASADIYDVEYRIECVGYADSIAPDPIFAREIAEIAKESSIYSSVSEYGLMNASEDCSAFINRVVSRGGKATYLLFGSHLASAHHTAEFDFDEKSMTDAAAFLSILALKYTK